MKVLRKTTLIREQKIIRRSYIIRRVLRACCNNKCIRYYKRRWTLLNFLFFLIPNLHAVCSCIGIVFCNNGIFLMSSFPQYVRLNVCNLLLLHKFIAHIIMHLSHICIDTRVPEIWSVKIPEVNAEVDNMTSASCNISNSLLDKPLESHYYVKSFIHCLRNIVRNNSSRWLKEKEIFNFHSTGS